MEVETHLQSAISIHLNLACEKLSDSERTTKQLMEKFDTLQMQLSVKLNYTEAKLNNTQAELKDTKIKLNNTETKLRDTENELKKTTKLVEQLDRRTFIWNITDFNEILRKAKTGLINYIDSPPFKTKSRTESYGYKLKARIHPNGCGLGKNSHLSVTIVVIKGEYDAILPWPIRKKITFTLIDQQEDPVERENVTKLFTTPNNPKCAKNFARPVKEENLGCGFFRFISHEVLHSRRYVVDGTLFLQVEIEPIDACMLSNVE